MLEMRKTKQNTNDNTYFVSWSTPPKPIVALLAVLSGFLVFAWPQKFR